MIAQRTIRGIELLKASVQIVVRREICYVDAAVIGCMDAAFGIGIIHKAIFAAALCNLIDLELIQIVSRLRVFRGNIAADSEVVLCILLNSKYLMQIRMERAAAYLKDSPETKIYEIGEKLGFVSTKHFISVFKKYYGVSPTTYQKEQRES